MGQVVTQRQTKSTWPQSGSASGNEALIFKAKRPYLMLLRLRPGAAMGIDDPFYPGGPFASQMLPRLYAPRGGI